MGVEIFRDGDALCIDGKGWEGLRVARRAHRLRQLGHDHAAVVRCFGRRPFHSELDGDTSLRQRPMQSVIDPSQIMGAKIRSKTGERVGAAGNSWRRNLTGIDYRDADRQRPGEVGNYCWPHCRRRRDA